MSVNPLPDPNTAYNNLFLGAHQQVFFRKCAAAGYEPRTQAEAQWMLEMAGKLRAVDNAPKTAADTNSPFFLANQALDQVLSQAGLDGGIKQARANDEDLALRQAAQVLAGDPLLYNSVLSLKAAEAEQIRQEYTQTRS